MKQQFRLFTLLTIFSALSGTANAAPDAAVLAQVAKEKPALLGSLQELVSIESGSRDLEGLNRLANHIAAKLADLGGKVELLDSNADVYRMEDTPDQLGKMVKATFTGKGKKKILMIAHMDTVYQPGQLAQQPFRVEGDRAYGLGIADDKQGIAVIMHTISALNALKYRDYGTLTVLINADEEISSPGSRSLITKLGAEHDAVFSFEASRAASDKLELATSGIASANLVVRGKASHAGAAPEQGINALYEMAHQVLQMRDLSDPATGIKVNWTLATAGMTRNVIPAGAKASADVRVLRVEDYDKVEQQLRGRIQKQLLPDAKVELTFERRRPPLELSQATRDMANHAQTIYREMGKELIIDTEAHGGGTDAAFAGMKTRSPVLERLGLQGFGAHTADAEYVLVSSIEPRLYLVTRLVMDIAQGKTK
ncbi:glutamate carboxypeptidase [Chitinivorax tropicus]|uniref:Glutamate carboxypeptidase n=1 Tax=Chitinivorax tropicus TaxID=714531 RepID=A0A840MKH1_9PROT|nr:M20/M25/M40 family metallo-hydrolase [Chitinivorax tropicus]MBB5017066.1 glutamate carboxypeptidase [Chitinivorax tropicus]